MLTRIKLLILLLLALVLVCCGQDVEAPPHGTVAVQFVSQPERQDAPSVEFSAPALSPASMATVEQVRPAVVRVNTDLIAGSGLIVQTQGSTAYVVTNHHVIEGASQIRVTVEDGRIYEGQIAGTNVVRDLAVLTICCGSFWQARLGDVAHLEPASEVLIIGYPRDLPGPATVTKGIVSAVRYHTGLQAQVIQTDAAINPGSSGGPMVSLGGEVLGIITFGVTDSEGLGFAISSDVVLRELPLLWARASPVPSIPPLVAVGTATPTPAPDLKQEVARIVRELMPRPTATAQPPHPETAAPTPAPAPPVVMPPAPSPTPTPHLCSRAELPSADDMVLVYRRFWTTNSPGGRQVIERLFFKQAADYIAQVIVDPLRYENFRDYLGRLPDMGYEDVSGSVRALLDSGVLPDEGESLYDYSQRLEDDPCTPSRIVLFDDDPIVALLATGYSVSRTSPFFGTGSTARLVDIFRDGDPDTPLIMWWLEVIGVH